LTHHIGSMTRGLMLLMLWLISSTAIASDELQFSEPEDLHLSEIEYDVACMMCHGIDGRGDGRDAHHLTTPPTDLTQIAMENGGVFPAERLTEFIDGRGREWSTSHGTREMPIWGERYAPDPNASGLPTARKRIDALVRFIEELQEE
jgi:hypothetical protein